MDQFLSTNTSASPLLNFIKPEKSTVWQCTNAFEFRSLILPYIIRNNQQTPLVYFRFGSQPPYFSNEDICTIHQINADDGFEAFTYQVYSIIASASGKTVYLFDLLSALQTSWVSDMMMANFFEIICPILTKAGSTGIFPILRDQHSFPAIRSIRSVAGIFLDLQIRGNYLRLQHPGQSKKQVTYYSVTENQIDFTPIARPNIEFKEEVLSQHTHDIWDRYFNALEILAKSHILSEQEHEKVCRRLMTQEEQMKNLIVKHFSPEDYLAVSKHLIGTGRIGGKACGFLLGRKLIQTYLPEVFDHMIPHDTYFIGTDVFYSYMVENNCWKYRLKHRLEQVNFQEIEPYREALLHGVFGPFTRRQFLKMLIHFGNTPIIIRSSSFLEDGYGNAFSGKYESVFCPNQGPLKKRLRELEHAIRTVYASTLTPSALAYRKKRNLLGQDEQMALLVQSVSGKQYGDLYFPLAAGVSFSYNPYRFMEHINPEAGMARLVAGLGTRAVNRTPGDYPKLVGLDRPQAMLWSTTREQHKYSQRFLDVINLTSGRIESIPCQNIIDRLTSAERKLVFSHDTEAEEYLLQQGRYREVYFTDCQGLAENKPFIHMLKQMLTLLETQYGCPVDIEFALDLMEDGSIGMDLLQCRPLKHKESKTIVIADHETSDVLFDIRQASMQSSKEETIDLAVIVDPKAYYETPHNQKPRIATAVGIINRQLEGRNAILIVPGRIGTSSPELGVPVNYVEINQFKVICEVSYSAAGYNPELSYGSHMFQDLVEADVFYAAINETRSTKRYQPDILTRYPDLYEQMCPAYPELNQVIQIHDLSENPGKLYLDAVQGKALCILSK